MKIAFSTNVMVGQLHNKATTQRKEGNFNSFVRLPDGRFLAAGKDGLCLLGGNTNNGIKIRAYFEPKEFDFGSPYVKRNRRCFLTLNNKKDAVIRFGYYPDNDLTKIKYVHLAATRNGTKTIPKALNYKLRGNTWTYRIENLSGDDFIIYGLHSTISTMTMNYE